MRRTSNEYIEYLKSRKEISKNTEISYRSDLDKMIEYFNLHRIFEFERINETNLNSYILYLELRGNSSATITRNIAVMKGYFDYLFKTHRIKECITDDVKRPTVQKNTIVATSRQQVNRILMEAEGDDAKSIRDYTILQLFCMGGVPVSELIEIELSGVNLEIGYVQSLVRGKIKTYSIDNELTDFLKKYMEHSRPYIVKEESALLFTNMQGQSMSRQGVWKMVKSYAKRAGIEEVSPAKLCRVSKI